ncbi:MAG: sugar transferase, partial [Syntrophobacteraceae bacterium]
MQEERKLLNFRIPGAQSGAAMFQQQVFILNIVLMALDALCVLCAGYSADFVRACQSRGLWTMSESSLSASIAFIMLINNVSMGKAGLYSDRRITLYRKLFAALLKVVTIDFAGLGIVLFLFYQRFFSRAFLLYFACLSLLFLTVERMLADFYVNQVCRKRFNALRLLVVGDEARARYLLEAFQLQISLGHEVIGHLAIKGDKESARKLSDLPRVLKEKQIDEVVFAEPGDKSFDLKEYIAVCSRMGIPARVLPALWADKTSNIKVDQCQGIPFLTINSSSFSAFGLVYKRLFDLFGSTIGLVILAMLYPFISVAIKLDSPGPVLFKQDRVGKNGRLFKLYKFRSMYTNAEERKRELTAYNELKGPMFKLRNDPRVTRVGRFLRRTSLDEIPQLFNVFTGKMSLVGTRPPTPFEVEQYNLTHYKRISAKPGLTGMWQVSGRNTITDFD